MLQDFLVTVYVLTYKRFDNLYRNLDSIFSQTYTNIELIISDDGSPDFPYSEILAYINRYKSSNIRNVQVFPNKINVGTVKHINNVLAKAHGKLYVPLAGDDVFASNEVLKKIVHHYLKSPFKILITSRMVFDQQGKPLFFYPHYLSREIIKRKMSSADNQYKQIIIGQFYDFFSGSVMVIEADFFKKIGGHDEKYRLWEDLPFVLKALKNGYKVSIAYDIISIYYILGGVSNIGGNPMMRSDIRLYNHTDKLELLNKYGKFTRRIVTYEKLRFDTISFSMLTSLRLHYWDVLIDRFIYKIGERMRQLFDRFYLRKI